MIISPIPRFFCEATSMSQLSSSIPENAIPLARACRLLPRNASDKPIHPATMFRWAAYGVGGVRLKVWKIGGRTFTTVEAIRAFIAARSGHDAPKRDVPDQAKVEEKLNRIGI